MAILKAAFIFLAPGSDPTKQRCVVSTPSVELHVVPVINYEQACKIAKDLVSEGVSAIELCGGFGHIGTSMIASAVGPNIPVGVVRFDIHPGLSNKSGDKLFKE